MLVPSLVVTDQTFRLAKLFGRTSTVRFGPNDRTFFCRTQNFFFSYNIQCRWHSFILLFCLMSHMYMYVIIVCQIQASHLINLKLFVCLLDLQFRSRFLSAVTCLVLFGFGRTVNHCFGRSLISSPSLCLKWEKGHIQLEVNLFGELSGEVTHNCSS